MAARSSSIITAATRRWSTTPSRPTSPRRRRARWSGAAKVNAEAPLVTGSEDFSFMLNARPGAFILIGAGVGPDGKFHDVHTPRYDFNDDILTLGAGYWVSLVHEELG